MVGVKTDYRSVSLCQSSRLAIDLCPSQPLSVDVKPVSVVLYAPLGAPCTSELHEALKAAVMAHPGGAVLYALRPVLPIDCQQVR